MIKVKYSYAIPACNLIREPAERRHGSFSPQNALDLEISLSPAIFPLCESQPRETRPHNRRLWRDVMDDILHNERTADDRNSRSVATKIAFLRAFFAKMPLHFSHHPAVVTPLPPPCSVDVVVTAALDNFLIASRQHFHRP